MKGYMRRVLIALAGASTTVFAQQPAITVGRTVTISADAPALSHAESHFAVNPKNSANMLAVSLVMRPNRQIGSVAYVSNDAGERWTPIVLPAESRSLLEGGDPITYFDGNGVGYFATNTGRGLQIVRTLDGGRTWSTPTALPGGRHFDRQFMAVDRTGAFTGVLYAGAANTSTTLDNQTRGTLSVATSADQGQTFGQLTILAGMMASSESPYSFSGMVRLADGTVVLPFITNVSARPDIGVSIPVGDTAGAPQGGARAFFHRVAISTDSGASYTISPRIGRMWAATDLSLHSMTQSAASSAADVSDGKYRGSIYIAYNDYAGERTVIKVVRSRDRGKTWSEPVAVTDANSPGYHANPAITVNNRGVVGITWNDRRAHYDACYDLAFAASTDGGETFSAPVMPGRPKTCPQAPENWLLRVSTYPWSGRRWGQPYEGEMLDALSMASRFLNGGDTQGLDSDSRGVFHAAWIDGSKGAMQLAHTSFTVGEPGAKKGVAIADRAAAPKVAGTDESPLRLVTDDCKVDWVGKTFVCDVRVKNISTTPVAGPFTISQLKIGAVQQGVTARNSDNGESGENASWTIAVPGNGSLAPGALTPPKRLVWSLADVADPTTVTFSFLFKVVAGGR
jgi:hypothetical protein